MLDILIVDDSRAVVETLTEMLSPYGRCESAVNGQEAVDRYRAFMGNLKVFDLVVMDVIMPVKDGVQAVKEIQAAQEEMGFAKEERSRIVMLSSVDDPLHMTRVQFEAGVDAYITKPFSLEILTEALVNLGLVSNPLGEVLDAINPEKCPH